MKVYFMIDFAINDANKTLSSAIVGFDSDHCHLNNYLVKELAKLAFKEVEKKYPNNKLTWVDYTCIGQNMVFVNI